MRNNKLSKSVRLSENIVNLIDALPGDNFTDKLEQVLDDYFLGLDKRKKEFTYYEDLVKKRKEELKRYNDLICRMEYIRSDVTHTEHLINEILKLLEE